MPKRAKQLSPVEVRRLTTPGNHAVGGCPGLLLRVADSGAASWILRVTVGGRRRDIGLGSRDEVSLKRAREKGREYRDKIREGVDPVAERKAARDALRAAEASRITFDEAARRYLASKRHEFRNAKHVKQWESTLKSYASPVVGKLPVHEITLAHVVQILEPIWYTKTETASRLRGRVEKVLAWATTSGYRSGENPARWKGCLDTILPKPSKVQKVQHHRALSVDEVGTFMAKLREREGMAARALEFVVLTATRSGEVRGATWDEIDLQGRVWTIPAERMKSGREHRVPLSGDAAELLGSLPRFEGTPYVFTAARGGQLSDMSLSAVMKRMKYEATPHGFRSTFRDWCSERTSYAHEVIEMSLAHVIPDKVERAYRRGDLFNKRARLMKEWATFCATIQPAGEIHSIWEAQG